MRVRGLLLLLLGVPGLLLAQSSARPAANTAPVSSTTQSCTVGQPAPALPLATSGRFIVDAKGRRYKLSGVAWYGAEGNDFIVGGLQLEPLPAIARRIRCLGFDAVRLPWSNEMYESNPTVPDYAVTANPTLRGKRALVVYDHVVQALAAEGLLVILDNHNSNAEWCCGNDGNELWYNAQYPEVNWIADWKGMVERYRNVPQVVAADLRNEPRGSATWGGDPATDWHAAAQRGGAAVLGVNPRLLVMVEGVNYALDLTGVADLPVQLPVANRLVYSPHDYPFDHNVTSSDQLAQQLDQAWGYIATPGQPYTAPLWLGEFGNCHSASNCVTDTTSGSSGLWFASLRQYLAQKDFDWSWWAINGTETTGSSRTFGSEETYGILNPYWNAPDLPNEINPQLNVAGALATIAEPSQGPQLAPTYPPLVALTTPLPGSTIVSGTTLLLSANATVAATSSDSVREVDFYANGTKVGAATTAPYQFAWSNIAPGTYSVRAQVLTTAGLIAMSDSVPVQALNYVAATSTSYSDAIAVNFVSYAVTPMAPSEIAGVMPQANWNQAGIANAATLPSLLDARGATTSAAVSWTSPNTYFTGIADTAGNNRMMKGYLDNSNTVPNTVSVAGLPSSFGHYDVIVYFDGGNGSDTRGANFRLTSVGPSGVYGCGGQTTEGSTVSGTDAASADFAGSFVQASGGSAGNYVMFLNCSGPSFQLAPVHGGSTNDQVRAPINGLQILAH